MRLSIYLALAVATLPTTVMATPASQFIEKWRAASKLPNTGVPPSVEMAAADPQIQALAAEFSAALQKYRSEILAARAAGKTPGSCPPKQLELTIDGLIADIERLPVVWQHRDLSDAFGKAMEVRYPCAAIAGTAGSNR